MDLGSVDLDGLAIAFSDFPRAELRKCIGIVRKDATENCGVLDIQMMIQIAVGMEPKEDWKLTPEDRGLLTDNTEKYRAVFIRIIQDLGLWPSYKPLAA